MVFWYLCVTLLRFVLVCFTTYTEADKIAKSCGTEEYIIPQQKAEASVQGFPVMLAEDSSGKSHGMVISSQHTITHVLSQLP